MGEQGNQVGYITFISVISAVSVLILHTNGCFWAFSSTARYWRSANIVECVFYFAVPLFYMISGITLMDFYDRTTLKGYFFKRFLKAGLPFLAWSLIGLAEKICIHSIAVEDVDLKFIYQGITGTSIVDIYWFFTPLFVVYLCMPLYAAVDKSKRKTVFTYVVIAGFVLNILVPFLKSVFSIHLNTPYNVPVASGALIWLPLGWLLHNCEIKKWHKGLIYALAVLGLSMHIWGTYVLSMEAGKIVSTYKGYQNVPCVLYSVGVFVLLKDIGTRVMHGKIAKLLRRMGRYTFPVYMMQFVLLDAVRFLPFINTKSLLYRLGAPFVMIPIIMAITWCMRKIPVIKKIVP